MDHPAGWYAQPNGEKLYWDGQKYKAAWTEGVGAVSPPEVAVAATPELGTVPTQMQSTPTHIQSTGFFASLFDFGFTSFITLKLLSLVYGLLVVLILVVGVVVLVAGISRGGTDLVIAVLGVPIGTLIYLVLTRVSLEIIALFFRIGENTSLMVAAAGVAGPTVDVPRTRQERANSGLDGPY